MAYFEALNDLLMQVLGHFWAHFRNERFWRSSGKWGQNLGPKWAKFDLLGKFWGQNGVILWSNLGFPDLTKSLG